MTAIWTIDELREAFAKSEFQLQHVEPLWSASEPAQYHAEFRCAKNPATFQFTFDSRFSLAANFEVVREEVADFPPAGHIVGAFGD